MIYIQYINENLSSNSASLPLHNLKQHKTSEPSVPSCGNEVSPHCTDKMHAAPIVTTHTSSLRVLNYLITI